MIFSAQQLFSDNQAITGSAASTNVLDTLATGTPAHAFSALEKDLGKGNPVPINVQVTEAFDLLTTLTIAVEVDDNEGFASAKVVDSQVIALADLVVGKTVNYVYLPRGTDERYLRLNYTVTGTDPAAGAIHAGIVAAVDQSWDQ